MMTEKHHCQNLLLIQKVFVESLERHFTSRNKDRLFPRLADLTDLHTGYVRNSRKKLTQNLDLFLIINLRIFLTEYRFLKKLRVKQKDNYIVDSIADLMIDFFQHQGEKLISAYGRWLSWLIN